VSSRSLSTSARELLSSWDPPDAAQDALRNTYLSFLDGNLDACLRSSVSGHLTGSVIVFDASLSYVLLTLHSRVGRWLQLGGHCEESDETIRDVAVREAWEESGIPDLRVTATAVALLDAHPVTCSLGVPTRHLDVQFAAVAHPTSDGRPPAATRGDESTDLAWWPTHDLPDDAGAGMSVLVANGLARAK
jgi:8-oxo-dGTP pyrophosphatase MutT (NUDIX family)